MIVQSLPRVAALCLSWDLLFSVQAARVVKKQQTDLENNGQCCYQSGCGDPSCDPNPGSYCNTQATCTGDCFGTWCPSGPAPTPPSPPSPPSPPGTGGGCCRFGADCGDCGEDDSGWCHQSASNCADCTGTFDPSGPAPNCGSNPSPPSPPVPSPGPPPPVPSPGPPPPVPSPGPPPPVPSPGPPPPVPSPSVPSPGPMTPVEMHGQLSVSGLKIVDKNGAPYQLKGMSMFWSQWSGQYWNADVVNWLAQDFQLNFIRAAMGADSGGYMDDPATEKAKLVTVVNACIDAGIYVMIDWHDHSAYDHADAAAAFFDEMASTYGNLPNVLFETFNEPLNDAGRDNWDNVLKPYHERINAVIRRHSQNIITMGTRSWSQEVDEACRNPVQGTNLMYTLHFYAQIHKGELRSKGDTAMNMGCPIFISEWGTGFDFLDLGSAGEWLNWADYHMLSNANWGVYDKAGEENALLVAGASGSGGWSDSQLTQSGKWVRDYLRRGPAAPSPGGSPGGGCCKFGADCGDCGEDGTGWCHQSASNCAICTGTFDSGAAAPSCR